jgi:hypothetical protein
MAVNFSDLIYSPNFDMWARTINVQSALGGAYTARGIYHSDTMNAPLDDGSMFSDQTTTLDILESEFAVLPQQDDIIDIPTDPDASPADVRGPFQVVDVWNNGGGETTLRLRRMESAD